MALGVPDFQKLLEVSAETRLTILNEVLQTLPDWMRKAIEQEVGHLAFAYLIFQDTPSMQQRHEPDNFMCNKIHGPLSHALWERALKEFDPMQQELLNLKKALDERETPS